MDSNWLRFVLTNANLLKIACSCEYPVELICPPNDAKNSDTPGNELDERGLLSLYGARCDFLTFRLREIQLGEQCLLGKHGPLNEHFRFVFENSNID